MRVISVLNLKGGVAKTFTAANVAYKRPCNRDCSRAYRVRPERSGRNKNDS